MEDKFVLITEPLSGYVKGKVLDILKDARGEIYLIEREDGIIETMRSHRILQDKHALALLDNLRVQQENYHKAKVAKEDAINELEDYLSKIKD